MVDTPVVPVLNGGASKCRTPASLVIAHAQKIAIGATGGRPKTTRHRSAATRTGGWLVSCSARNHSFPTVTAAGLSGACLHSYSPRQNREWERSQTGKRGAPATPPPPGRTSERGPPMRPLPHLPRTVHGVLGAFVTTLATVAALFVATPPAQADTTVCEQFGSAVVQGRYVVQNNRWGTGEPQCVTTTDTGFRVTRADGSVPTNGAPKSYPPPSTAATTPTAPRGPTFPRSSRASPARRAASRTAMSAMPCTTPRTTSGWTRRPVPTA